MESWVILYERRSYCDAIPIIVSYSVIAVKSTLYVAGVWVDESKYDILQYATNSMWHEDMANPGTRYWRWNREMDRIVIELAREDL